MMDRDDQMILREHLRGYVNEDGRSIAGLARRASLSELTVRRVLQGESKASFETAMRLLRVTASPEATLEILGQLYPDMIDSIRRVKLGMKSNFANQQSVTARVFTSTPACYIANLAASRSGVTLAQILDEYGKSGVKVAEEMLEAGVLVEQADGVLRYFDETVSSSDESSVISIIRNFLDAFEKDVPGRYASFQFETFNAEGVNAVRRAVAECYDRIDAIKQDSRYAGDFPVFACAFVNRLMVKEGN